MKKEITVKPTDEKVEEVTAFVEGILEENGIPFRITAQVNIAIDEIFSNIARYSGADSVTVTCIVTDDEIVLEFKDNGKPYDPTGNSDPDTTLSADEREIGGLGIFMVKKTMDEISYSYSGNTNILTIRKVR